MHTHTHAHTITFRGSKCNFYLSISNKWIKCQWICLIKTTLWICLAWLLRWSCLLLVLVYGPSDFTATAASEACSSLMPEVMPGAHSHYYHLSVTEKWPIDLLACFLFWTITPSPPLSNLLPLFFKCLFHGLLCLKDSLWLHLLIRKSVLNLNWHQAV